MESVAVLIDRDRFPQCTVPLELLHQVQHYHGRAVSPYEISEVLLSAGDVYIERGERR